MTASVYRDSVVEHYRTAPRQQPGSTFDPATMAPQWWSAVMAAVVLTVAVGLGMTVPVTPNGRPLLVEFVGG